MKTVYRIYIDINKTPIAQFTDKSDVLRYIEQLIYRDGLGDFAYSEEVIGD
jgi:hypothetical protein